MKRLKWGLALLVSLGLVTTMGVLVPQPAVANPSPQATVGMPFTGQWAYSNPTSAVCGPNSTQTSHPSCHEIYFGDWSVDLYNSAGTDVYLRVAGNGTLSFAWGAASGTCGDERRVHIYVDGAFVGAVQYSHLVNPASTGSPPTNGMKIGQIANLSCNPGGSGKHIHVEFNNTSSTSYSCYVDHSGTYTAGMTLSDGTHIGTLGSSNTGPKQPCAVSPGGPPPTVHYVVTRETSNLYQANVAGPWAHISASAAQGSWRVVGSRVANLDTNGLWVRDGNGPWNMWSAPDAQEFQISPNLLVTRVGSNLYRLDGTSLQHISNTAAAGSWQLSWNRIANLDANGLWLKDGNGPWQLVSNSATPGNWKLVGNRLAVLDANGLWVKDGTNDWQHWSNPDPNEFQISEAKVVTRVGSNLYENYSPNTPWTLISGSASAGNWQLSENRVANLDANGLWLRDGQGAWSLASNTASPGSWKLSGSRLVNQDSLGVWIKDGTNPPSLWSNPVVEFGLG